MSLYLMSVYSMFGVDWEHTAADSSLEQRAGYAYALSPNLVRNYNFSPQTLGLNSELRCRRRSYAERYSSASAADCNVGIGDPRVRREWKPGADLGTRTSLLPGHLGLNSRLNLNYGHRLEPSKP